MAALADNASCESRRPGRCRVTYDQIKNKFGGPTAIGRVLGGLDRRTVDRWRSLRRIPSKWQLRLAGMFPDLKADKEARRHMADLAPFIQRIEQGDVQEA